MKHLAMRIGQLAMVDRYVNEIRAHSLQELHLIEISEQIVTKEDHLFITMDVKTVEGHSHTADEFKTLRAPPMTLLKGKRNKRKNRRRATSKSLPNTREKKSSSASTKKKTVKQGTSTSSTVQSVFVTSRTCSRVLAARTISVTSA